MAEPKMDVSVRDQLTPVAPGQSLFDVLRKIGVAGIEAFVGTDDELSYVRVKEGAPFTIGDAESIRLLKRRLADEGMRISALLLGTDFSGPEAEKHVEWAVRATRAARELNAPAVRIDTWTSRKELPVPQVRDNFVRRVTQVLDRTADTGIDLGIENHGHISNDPQFLDSVFAAVGNPRLGMTLDTGNFYWWGHPLEELYRLLERYAPRAKHTHIKNINYPPDLARTQRPIGFEYGKYCSPLDEGNIDMHRVVSIFHRAGYTRDLCVENEALGKYAPDQQVEVLRRDVWALRQALLG
jgi:sugar phosphate isomerase/epimerase